jgi:hypothetical protein
MRSPRARRIPTEDDVKTKQELVNGLKERRRRIDELNEKVCRDHSASSALATADLEGNMTHVNQAFLRQWDIDDTPQIYGKPFRIFWALPSSLFTKEPGLCAGPYPG